MCKLPMSDTGTTSEEDGIQWETRELFLTAPSGTICEFIDSIKLFQHSLDVGNKPAQIMSEVCVPSVMPQCWASV